MRKEYRDVQYGKHKQRVVIPIYQVGDVMGHRQKWHRGRLVTVAVHAGYLAKLIDRSKYRPRIATPKAQR